MLREKKICSDAYKVLVLQLKEARHSKKLDQEHLGRMLGKDQRYISNIESLNQILNVEELYDFCTALNVEFEEIVRTYGQNMLSAEK